jgi:hypothetical protein
MVELTEQQKELIKRYMEAYVKGYKELREKDREQHQIIYNKILENLKD